MKSVEDHGYVMSFGDKNAPPSFLPFTPSQMESGVYHHIGQVLEVAVKEKKGKSSSAVLLSADAGVISKEKMVRVREREREREKERYFHLLIVKP